MIFSTSPKSLPRKLIHGSGKPMTLVRDHLLLAFTKPIKTPGQLEKLLKASGTGLVLVKPTKQNKYGPTERINHTSKRFWVRTSNKKPVAAKCLAAFDTKNWRERLEWIGPVYKVAKSKGYRGYVCPLPTAFLLKQAWENETPEADQRKAELSTKLALFRFKEVQDNSKYPFRYWYAERPSTEEETIYALQVDFEKKKKDPTWTGHQLVERVNFDIMPMVVRTAQYIPDDPYYNSDQWNMRRIHAEEGWRVARGNGVRVAIFDFGFDLNHPEFSGRFTDGINLWDNSGNGMGNPNDPHGTACAGVIGAEMDNQQGIAGLAPKCEIIPMAFENADISEVVDGIEHAVDSGADIICISHESAGWDDDDAVDKALDYAHQQGILICAASGNDGGAVIYPARQGSVMACGALDTQDSPAGFSNGGPELSVLAPGVKIPSTAPIGNGDGGGDYFLRCWGTSYAAPHVAGLAALLISAYPGHLRRNPQAVRTLIEQTAEPLLGQRGRNNRCGFGLIDVNNAFRLAQTRFGRLNPLP